MIDKEHVENPKVRFLVKTYEHKISMVYFKITNNPKYEFEEFQLNNNEENKQFKDEKYSFIELNNSVMQNFLRIKINTLMKI